VDGATKIPSLSLGDFELLEKARRERGGIATAQPPAAGNLRPMAAKRTRAAVEGEQFLESLMDTSLYSMGAYFSDQHPDLVDEVIAQSEAIERAGLQAYAAEHGISLESCFETLLTGLAVRYYNAVAA
jgi:hypothetical protein